MVDFNTKKNILQKLRKKRSENKLLWLPCVIAAAFVKLWYGAACGIGMAFSDKNGNFLGIKTSERKRKPRRQDDIVYIKKPFIGRVMSAVLAAAFVLMVAPELDIDLGVTARAAEITDSVEVKKPNGDSEYYYIDTNRSNSEATYLFKTTDYDTARVYTVSNIRYDIADRAIRVHWEYDHTGKYGMLRGFHIRLIQTGTNGTTTIYDDDVFESTSRMLLINNSVANRGQLIPGSTLNVEINPIIDLDEWRYMGRLTADEEIEEINIAPADVKFQINNENANGTNVTQGGNVSFNTGFNKPVLVVNNGEVDCYGTSLTLTWNEVVQNGGNMPNTPAEGYNIYKKAGNDPFVKLEGVFTDTTYTDTDILPGTTYQYFIEAFRNVWGDSGYNPSNDGIISSSGTNVAANPQNKYSSYVNEAKQVYVAPLEPNLTVTPMTGRNSISITPNPSYGNYSGVFLFRTTGETDINEQTDGVILNGRKFGEWFYITGVQNNNTFGIEYLGQITGTSGTFEDTNIVEGQNYWYYAVSYLGKGGNNRLYSEYVSSQRSRLSININTPTSLIANPGDGQVRLTWDAVSGAEGYEIRITKVGSHDSDTSDLNIPEVFEAGSNTSYLHDRLYNNDIYTYEVRSYVNIKSIDANGNEQGRRYSDWTKRPARVTVGLPISPPNNVTATTTDETITVTWDPVDTAMSYTLHYTNNTVSSKSGEISGISGTTYTHRGLTNDEQYTYTVVAHKTITGDQSKPAQDIASDPSNSVTIRVGQPLTIPQDLAATTVDGAITVTWTAVPGASGYILYYRNTTNGTSGSFDIARTSFTHTGLNNGDVYEYRVEAYKTMTGSGDRVSGPTSLTITKMVGDVLNAPKDFTVTTADGVVNMSWTAVAGAEGYIIHASSGGRYYQFDVSKLTYVHSDLNNGDIWTYYVTAYKTVNGTRTYSNPSESKTVTIGISLNSAVDLTATAGNRQIDLTWTAVNGADGYVVYLYNSSTMEFEPITVTSKTTYSHVGLKNGKQYTYMVAPYKNINGKRFYGDYSMSVTAIPTTGSITDMDHELIVKGTAPYGISHSEYITAVSNHGAFDESVDVYFSTNRESTQTVRDVLQNYANGLSSFIIYPFDISIYRENTYIEVDPEDGYTVTVTMPVPDRLIAYRDYITVVHIGDGVEESEEISLAEDWFDNYDQRLEVLPCAIVDIDNVWCVQFKCSSFSPYALVIYKEHIQDVAAGGGLMDTGFADTFNSGVLLFTALPDIMPNNRKLKIVQSGSKRYRIKSISKK